MSDHRASGRTLFIADLHLTDERPPANRRFFHFLDDIASGADALYILGDLFEYWIGDDDDSAIAAEIAHRLHALVHSGTPVYFMHGNRDFLLASRFARAGGLTLLSDPTCIDLYGTRTLLMHGDTLCTDDTQYQRLRKWLRRKWVTTLLAALPRSVRIRLARDARADSERAKAEKDYAIMDVNAQAVIAALCATGAQRMIHGHTHRPARHEIELGIGRAERWVLPDWYGTGGYLSCTSSGCALISL